MRPGGWIWLRAKGECISASVPFGVALFELLLTSYLSLSLLQESQRAVGRQLDGPLGGVPAQRRRPLSRIRSLLRPLLLRLFRQVIILVLKHYRVITDH